jgi:Mn2+/Fe2+ NRAMP family transporter
MPDREAIALSELSDMKKFLDTALGILTSVGAFLEVGSLVTAMQAGAEFGYQLLWVVAIGTVAAVSLTEMSGRFAAVSQRAFGDALRERFGFRMFFLVLVGLGITSLLVLGAEVIGVAVALELATGIRFTLWGLPVGLFMWLILWKGKFSLIEYGVAGLGLVTLTFVVAAFWLGPNPNDLLTGLIPSGSTSQPARYWFLALSILGATITPYLFYFYSSGALEDGWDTRHIATNRVVATIGMTFGGGLSGAVLIVAAIVLEGTRIEHYIQLPQVLEGVFGRAGFWLFLFSLWIGCLGAALEISLTLAYVLAQGLGWRWAEDARPRDAVRFVLTYTGFLVVATVFAVVGVDVLSLTNLAMALSSAVLPIALFPLLVLMNDRRYLGEHRNGWVANGAGIVIAGMAVVLFVVSVPLAILGQ